MHSSVGTGSLAYTVGSKLMDVRVAFNGDTRKEEDEPVVETSPVKEQSKSNGTAVTPREASNDAFEESLNENLNLIVRKLSKRERTAGDVQEGTSSSDELSLQEPLPGKVDSLETTLLRKPGAGLVKKRTSIEDDQKSAQSVDSLQKDATREVSCNVEYSTLTDMDVEGQKEEERSVPAKEDSNFIKSVDLDSIPGPRLSGDAQRVTDWLWTLHRIGKYIDRVQYMHMQVKHSSMYLYFLELLCPETFIYPNFHGSVTI